MNNSHTFRKFNYQGNYNTDSHLVIVDGKNIKSGGDNKKEKGLEMYEFRYDFHALHFSHLSKHCISNSH